VKQEIAALGLRDRVTLSGLIPHDELPELLNRLKLLVLPSYTEGVPTIILEAMACGVPVVATPVGGIPDVVRDGETGFILEDNTPPEIARVILQALACSRLERVAQQASELIRRERSFEAGIAGWRYVLGRVRGEVAARVSL
jgi:glycosyltransferase involved in cell wall biosynthesis